MQDARRWVVDTCAEIARDDLVECAELGVSELVTNALLHGEPPIQVRVRGTQEHPRVEVRDGSNERPVLPSSGVPDDDELLLTFGRGLSIVARAADAWGAEIEDDGKIVWFAPAVEFSEGEGSEGRITGVTSGQGSKTRESSPDLLECVILGVPVTAYISFQRHYRELRREVRLLALAHEEHYPLAKSLSDLFGSLEQPLRDGMGRDQVEAARESGVTETDVHVVMGKQAAQRIDRFIELLDLADAFCREERLLSLARSPEQRKFQNWFLGEFVRQSNGAEPIPWTKPEPARLRRTSVS